MSTGLHQNNSAFAARLRLLRASKKWSLEELSNQLGVSRQYLHQIETNERPPSAELVEAICPIFSVKPSFFEKPLGNFINSEAVNFRHRATTPDNAKRSIVSKSIILADFLEVIENYVDFPAVDIPKRDAHTPTEIEEAAAYTRDYYGIPQNAPISNIFRVAERAGIITCTFSNHEEKIDAFSVLAYRPLVVIVGQELKSPARARFDVAHELGHLVIHSGVETGSNTTERQADLFASSFLMPREQLLKELPKGYRISWQKLSELKVRWRVSLAALVRRAYDLHVFDEDQYRKAMIHLSKTGQRKREKDDNKIRPERPELLDEAFNFLKNNPRLLQSVLSEIDLEPLAVADLFGVYLKESIIKPNPEFKDNIVTLFD